MNVEKVTHEQLEEVLEESFKVKIPVFVHGTFGIGKTDTVKATGKKIVARHNSNLNKGETPLTYSEDFDDQNEKDHFMIRTIPAHHLDAGDLKGLAFPNAERTKTAFLPTDYLPTTGQGMLFFDELNLAAPMIQANLYQIILDRRLGKYKVPEGYTCIAAGNTEDDRSHAFSMALPLKNRFIHVQLRVPEVKAWIDNFALPHQIDHRIISFLKGVDKYLHNYDPNKASDEAMLDEDLTAIATPRTWAFLSQLIKSIIPDNRDKDENEFSLYKKLNRMANATVGIDVGNAFIAWLKLSHEYDIDKIYTDEKLPKKVTAVDQLYSLGAALLSYYLRIPETDTKRKEKIAITYAKLTREFPRDHGVMLMHQAKVLDPTWLTSIKKDKVLYDSLVKENTKFLI